MEATYATVKQSLPTVETIDTFVSAHPVAIAQLSIQYCNALVEDPARARAVLPGLRLQRGAVHGLRAGGTRDRARRADRTHVRTNVATEPDAAGVRTELDA